MAAGVSVRPGQGARGQALDDGDNRTHSGDSRAHCQSRDRDAGLDVDIDHKIYCTGDPNIGTVPVANVIGKARFIAWPPGRWGAVKTVNPQT